MIKDLKSMDENIRIVQDAIFWHQVSDNSYSNKYIEKFIREYCLNCMNVIIQVKFINYFKSMKLEIKESKMDNIRFDVDEFVMTYHNFTIEIPTKYGIVRKLYQVLTQVFIITSKVKKKIF